MGVDDNTSNKTPPTSMASEFRYSQVPHFVPLSSTDITTPPAPQLQVCASRGPGFVSVSCPLPLPLHTKGRKREGLIRKAGVECDGELQARRARGGA